MAMNRYQQKVIDSVDRIFNEAAKQDDWKTCYEQVTEFIETQLSRSFWNGVKWQQRKSRS